VSFVDLNAFQAPFGGFLCGEDGLDGEEVYVKAHAEIPI